MNTINVDLDSLIEAVVPANTPAYVYKRLRSNPSVIRLARQNSGEDLLRAYTDASLKRTPTIQDIALGYAALIAITLKDRREANQLLDVLTADDLEFGRGIKRIFQTQPTSVERTSITLPPAACAGA